MNSICMHSLVIFWVRRYKFYILTMLSTALISCSLLLTPSEGLQAEQARSADSFIDSIGVAVHLNYGDTAYKKYDQIVFLATFYKKCKFFIIVRTTQA